MFLLSLSLSLFTNYTRNRFCLIRLSLIKRRNAVRADSEDMSEKQREKEVAPPPPPGFEDVKAGAHLDEVAQVAEKLAKGEDLRLGTKKEGTVDAPDLSLKTGQLKSWADEEVRFERFFMSRVSFSFVFLWV